MTADPSQTPPAGRLLPRRPRVEAFWREGDGLRHDLPLGPTRLRSVAPGPDPAGADAKSDWWAAYGKGVRATSLTHRKSERSPLRMVDLFSGVGGLALGLRQALDEAGIGALYELIVDVDAGATQVYAANHAVERISTEVVSTLIDWRVRRTSRDIRFVYPPEILDPKLQQNLDGVDLVMGGPPCQGHSNLNNRTRRDDQRNHLLLTVPAFAVAVGARMVLIENVPSVRRDRSGVVNATIRLLESAGYFVETGTFAADRMGWPQTRQRFFLVARREDPPIPFEVVARTLSDETPRTLEWMIGDLAEEGNGDPLHRSADLSAENRRRIAWLFENDAYELANAERPVCHRGGTSYGAVYGRLHWDRPAPTITTGFSTPGRGRFVHPGQRRTLTPREAARLQGFPDDYRFALGNGQPPTRSQLCRWIGNAVPMPLAYAAALSVLGPEL